MSGVNIYLMRGGTVSMLRNLILHKGACQRYIGEDISISSHMIAAGKNAKILNCHKDLIRAALLHDIGHLLAEDDTGGYGVSMHAQYGAAFIRGLGIFSERVSNAIEHHVNAKRFIVGEEPRYLLSNASEQTLKYQGGPMTLEERIIFASKPYFNDAMAIRQIDDTAKVKELSQDEIDEELCKFNLW